MIGFCAHSVWRPLALLCVSLLTSCASYPSIPEIAAEINATLQPSPTVFIPGDTIEVKFPYKGDFDHTVTVRPDGRVTFLNLDEIHVAGMDIGTLDRMLTKAYRDRGGLELQQAELTVNLTNLQARNVIVMGDVGSSGAIPIEGGRLSLIEALGRAGGPDKMTADLSELLLIRWMAKEGRQRVWQIDARIKYWQSGVPIFLQPHDIIFIPNTTVDAVNTWIDQYIRKMIPLPGFVPLPN